MLVDDTIRLHIKFGTSLIYIRFIKLKYDQFLKLKIW